MEVPPLGAKQTTLQGTVKQLFLFRMDHLIVTYVHVSISKICKSLASCGRMLNPTSEVKFSKGHLLIIRKITFQNFILVDLKKESSYHLHFLFTYLAAIQRITELCSLLNKNYKLMGRKQHILKKIMNLIVNTIVFAIIT